MSMTLVITRNVPDRFRGFLASVLCEVTPGVYAGPGLRASVRDRVWQVLTEWFAQLGTDDMAVVMTWPDARSPGGQTFLTLGVPRIDLRTHDDMVLVRCELTEDTRRSLTTHEERNRARTPDEASDPNASSGG
ncbi:MAG: type I-E CRISPR-associated endoribonuclease Cas2 [Myxococcales bacterium]|nr:type I-E CRISPR-associated endoribonuclease Cas2 [Myxococcales bacterium]